LHCAAKFVRTCRG